MQKAKKEIALLKKYNKRMQNEIVFLKEDTCYNKYILNSIVKMLPEIKKIDYNEKIADYRLGYLEGRNDFIENMKDILFKLRVKTDADKT